MRDLRIPLTTKGLCRGDRPSHKKTYFGPNVLITRRADQREADQEHIGLGIRERTESVVILLPSSIPQSEGDGLPIDHYIGRVVIKYCRGGGVEIYP